ncbi:ssDNA endonuclease and repair protein rad10 [Xylographa soralifera]|nr:ssDNA endonuclease and repair protein rad10 [Xylographa soralifera]MCJ1383769.1 ssDNA endonuclease and repair protein rad10 [Xylographa soralifera]
MKLKAPPSPHLTSTMDDDPFADADLTAAVLAAERSYRPSPSRPAPAPASSITPGAPPKVQQPTPQALPSRKAISSILVSTRQKGNPILKNITALPWEYADIPADYTLGATTCCLFLSLKYHRLHPEYIYTRIRALQHQYNLRVLLTMVDIENHEESLRELAKTSLVNNLTLVLCWSAREAARYVELYKSFENASASAIRQTQGTGYAERMVEFVTTPRSINKADAVGLVSAFGSVRAAVNAVPEEVAGIAGWGEKKVGRWCGSVREGFRVRRADKKGLQKGESEIGSLGREDSLFEGDGDETDGVMSGAVGAPIPIGRLPSRELSGLAPIRASGTPDAERRPPKRVAEDVPAWEPGEDEEEALLFAVTEEQGAAAGQSIDTAKTVGAISAAASKRARLNEPELSEGMAAALAKLRQT